jgi:hypothetical protein
MVLVLRLFVVFFARTDSRPCVVWSPSLATSYFLLLVQKKVTKEKTPSRPRFAGIHAGKLREQAPGFADSTSLY